MAQAGLQGEEDRQGRREEGIEVQGRLLKGGRELATAVLTMGVLSRPPAELGRFDPRSMFGIWVGGLRLPAKIGFKWARKLLPAVGCEVR